MLWVSRQQLHRQNSLLLCTRWSMADGTQGNTTSSSYLDLDDPFGGNRSAQNQSAGLFDSVMIRDSSGDGDGIGKSTLSDGALSPKDSSSSSECGAAKNWKSEVWDTAVRPVADMPTQYCGNWVDDTNSFDSGFDMYDTDGRARSPGELSEDSNSSSFAPLKLREHAEELISVSKGKVFMVPKKSLLSLIKTVMKLVKAHQHVLKNREFMLQSLRCMHAEERQASLSLLTSLQSEMLDDESASIISQMKALVEAMDSGYEDTIQSVSDSSVKSESTSQVVPMVPDITRPPPPVCSNPAVTCIFDLTQPPPPLPSLPPMAPPPLFSQSFGGKSPTAVISAPYMFSTRPPPNLPPMQVGAFNGPPPRSLVLPPIPPSFMNQRRRVFHNVNGVNQDRRMPIYRKENLSGSYCARFSGCGRTVNH